MSVSAYKNVIRQSEAPRQIERRVFAKITSDLEVHAEDFDYAETYIDRIEILSGGLRLALQNNLKLWSTLKFDLASATNALSPELRAGLLSIALWVERQTAEVLGGETGAIDLINVNRSILDGLSGMVPDYEEA
jgi:flagellar biosynthesis activator protein FlaF